MPSLQIITMLVVPEGRKIKCWPHLSVFNNVPIKDIDKYKSKAMSDAQATLEPGGCPFPVQTVLVAENSFPCYDNILP